MFAFPDLSRDGIPVFSILARSDQVRLVNVPDAEIPPGPNGLEFNLQTRRGNHQAYANNVQEYQVKRL